MNGQTEFAVPPGKIVGLAALYAAGLLMAAPLHAQDRFVGTWSGQLDVGAAQLSLVLHVEPGENGLTATMDSPDQGTFGIEASGVTTRGDSLIVEFADIGGQFASTIDAEGASLSGTWSQSGQVFPLVLERGEPEQVHRPQNPEGPFPYSDQEVKFAGGSAGVELAGTLTLPSTGPASRRDSRQRFGAAGPERGDLPA